MVVFWYVHAKIPSGYATGHARGGYLFVSSYNSVFSIQYSVCRWISGGVLVGKWLPHDVRTDRTVLRVAYIGSSIDSIVTESSVSFISFVGTCLSVITPV